MVKKLMTYEEVREELITEVRKLQETRLKGELEDSMYVQETAKLMRIYIDKMVDLALLKLDTKIAYFEIGEKFTELARLFRDVQ